VVTHLAGLRVRGTLSPKSPYNEKVKIYFPSLASTPVLMLLHEGD
jgi:hypothetical protein